MAVEFESTTELEAAALLLDRGSRLLVLGGSCLVAVGLCAAMSRIGHRPALVYLDRHLDLNTPISTDEGSLSWMGMAHALDLPGADSDLVAAAGPAPLLDPDHLVYLGADLTQTTPWEREQAAALGLSVISQAEMCEAPRRALDRALSLLPSGPFVVHVDVDVLDFIDAPLAENVNGCNSGPTVEQLGVSLAQLVAHPSCWGLSLGQLDPAHASSDPPALVRFVDAIVHAVGHHRERPDCIDV